MMHTVMSAALVGLELLPVRVEVAVRRGTPMIGIVGLAPSTARDCRERVRSAAAQLGLRIPGLRITVNLSPADLRKASASFDLPVAVAVLMGAGHVPRVQGRPWAFVGELGLDGRVRGVCGALPIALGCRDLAGIRGLIVPEENLEETRPVRGIRVLGASSLAGVIAFLRDEGELTTLPSATETAASQRNGDVDLSDVAGQQTAKRALEIAAAGAHNVLMRGPPGAGKTMLARAVPGILPPLAADEAVESTAVHSVAGLLPSGTGLLRERPFRAPHHTVTTAGLVGGGSPIRPGEVALAHNGVLFLDELPEFRPPCLDALRQPLEEGEVRITRAGRTVRFPASFLLLAAMNPCRCGRLTDADRSCTCEPAEVRRHMTRVSGPLLDRIDMLVDVPPVRWHILRSDPGPACSPTVRERVSAAREIMRRRSSGTSWVNSRIPGPVLRRLRTAGSAERLLDAASRRHGLSARSCHRVLRVARTIADLEGHAIVSDHHVAEAILYRVAEFRP